MAILCAVAVVAAAGPSLRFHAAQVIAHRCLIAMQGVGRQSEQCPGAVLGLRAPRHKDLSSADVVVGAQPKPGNECAAEGHRDMSLPTSLNSMKTSIINPGIWVRSTPKSLYASVRMSKSGSRSSSCASAVSASDPAATVCHPGSTFGSKADHQLLDLLIAFVICSR